MLTIDEIVAASRSGFSRVTPETAGYLVLAAADGLVDDPQRLGGVRLREDGGIELERSSGASEGDAEATLRSALRELLGPASTRPSPLARVSGTTESRGLRRFIAELEAALIPVNRSAAKRALARLYRDVGRARRAGRLESGDAPLAAVSTPVASHLEQPRGTPIERPAPEPVSPPPVAHPDTSRPSATLTPVKSELRWTAPAPEPTPFLGSWMAVAPVVSAPSAQSNELDHDTDRVPPVSAVPFDEPSVQVPTRREDLTLPLGGVAVLAVVDAAVDAAHAARDTVEVLRMHVVSPVDESSSGAAAAREAAPMREREEAQSPSPSEGPLHAVYKPRKSDVSELIAGFGVTESPSLTDLSRELKRFAGVAATPGPPEARIVVKLPSN